MIFKGSLFWAGLEQCGGQVVQLLAFAVMARFLKPEDFGLYAFANIFFVTTRAVVGTTFVDSLVQKKIGLTPLAHPSFWLVGFCFSVFVPLISGLGYLLEKPLHMPGLFPVLGLLSLGFFSFGLSVVPEAICVEHLKLRPLALRRLVEQLAGGLVGVGTAVLGWGTYSFVAQVLTGSALGTILLWSFTSFRPVFCFNFASLAPLRSFFLKRLATVFANAFGLRMDSFFVGALLGPAALGFYAVAWRLYTVTSVFTNHTINRFAFPYFVLHKDDGEKNQQSFRMFTQLACLLGSWGYLALFSLASPLLISFFGSQWKPAIPVLMALALLGVVGNSLFVGNLLLRALGHADLELRYVLLPILTNLCLLPFTTPHGLLAVVATLLFSTFLAAPLLLSYLKKEARLGWADILRSGIRPWTSGGIASLVTWFFLSHASMGANLNSVAQLFIGGVMFVFTFVLIIFLVDRKFIVSLFSKNIL